MGHFNLYEIDFGFTNLRYSLFGYTLIGFVADI
jgi:hypothetical protein